MDTKEIKLSDGTILTPANPLMSKEDIQEFSKMISSPECQNHMLNQAQKQLYDSLGFSSPNPPKNLMVKEQSKTNKLIELSNKQISDLQNQLKNSET